MPLTDDPYQRQDWPTIAERLIAYARRRLGRCARIQDAEDLAMKAISRVLDPHYRAWNPETGTLLFHLKSEVNGLVSNQRRTLSRSQEELVDTTDEADGKTWSCDDKIIHRIGAGQLLEAVLAIALERSDEVAQLLLLEAHDGVVMPRDVAAKLGLPIGRVNEARRRLREYYQVVLRREEESDG